MTKMQLTGTYADNDFPVTGNRYLWIRKYSGGDSYAEIVYPAAVFDYLDMADFYDDGEEPEHRLYLLRPDKAPLTCEAYGTWHNLHDPLRMEIRTSRGRVLDVGYGTNH